MVFGVAGFLWGLPSAPCGGVRCQGVVRAGCPPPLYFWGWARLRSRQVTPGVPGSLWPRGVVVGVVVPPVWTHDGAGAAVVGGASAARCWCVLARGVWGAEVDGPEDVGAVALDGARARTFVALVAVVARDRGGRVVIVAVLWEEEEELCCRAPRAIILATAALPYVPGRGGGTCGCWARSAGGWRLRGRGMPLHVTEAAISL